MSTSIPSAAPFLVAFALAGAFAAPSHAAPLIPAALGSDVARFAPVTPAAPAPDSLEIRGRVVRAGQVDAGIPGAIVTLEGHGLFARTDRQGAFRIVAAPSSDGILRAEAPGFVTAHTPLPASDGSIVELLIELHLEPVMLDAVVASVSPLHDRVAYQTAHALTGDELTRRLATSAGAMLDGEPGVSVRSLGPAPTRPVIRGFDGDRVVVLENGERMGDLAETAADHALSLDPLAVDRIEVVRGPASLLYGASALGGVVNLFTSDLPATWSRGWSGSAATQGVSVNRSAAVQAQSVYGSRDWAATGRLSVRRAGDLRTPESRLPGTGLSSLDGQLGAVRERGHLRTGLSASIVDRSYGIPESVDDEHEEIVIAMERRALQGRLDWTPEGAGTIEGLEVRFNLARFFQQEFAREFDVGSRRLLLSEVVGLEFLQHSLTATATVRHGPLGIVDQGAAGVSLRGRNLEVGGDDAFTPGIREGTVGLFTFQEVHLAPAWRLQFGARTEVQAGRTLSNDDFPDADERRRSTALSGSFGLNWRPAPRWEVGGQFARAHRNPSPEELFAGGPHLGAGTYEIGDPSLADEVGHGVDLFVRRGSERISLELAAFDNRIRDFVAFQPTGEVDAPSGLPIFVYEPAQASMRGGEATLSAAFSSGVRIAAGLDYVRGERRNEGTASTPLPSIPPLRGRLDLRYDTPRGWIGATTRAVAAQDRVAPQEDQTAGYVLLDLDAGLRIDRRGHHTLVVRVDNATNRLYRDHLSRVEERGFPMPARSLAVVLRTRF
jgi:iron complex outermembrane recepter protein